MSEPQLVSCSWEHPGRDKVVAAICRTLDVPIELVGRVDVSHWSAPITGTAPLTQTGDLERQ